MSIELERLATEKGRHVADATLAAKPTMNLVSVTPQNITGGYAQLKSCYIPQPQRAPHNPPPRGSRALSRHDQIRACEVAISVDLGFGFWEYRWGRPS